jgi:hypothetical protein
MNQKRPDVRRDAARLDLRLDLPLSCPDTRLGIKVSELNRPGEF